MKDDKEFRKFLEKFANACIKLGGKWGFFTCELGNTEIYVSKRRSGGLDISIQRLPETIVEFRDLVSPPEVYELLRVVRLRFYGKPDMVVDISDDGQIIARIGKELP